MKTVLILVLVALALAKAHQPSNVQIPDSNSLGNSNPRQQQQQMASSNVANSRPVAAPVQAEATNPYGTYANNFVQEPTNQYQYTSPQNTYQATQAQYYPSYYYPEQQYAQGKLAFGGNMDGGGFSLGGGGGGGGGGNGGSYGVGGGNSNGGGHILGNLVGGLGGGGGGGGGGHGGGNGGSYGVGGSSNGGGHILGNLVGGLGGGGGGGGGGGHGGDQNGGPLGMLTSLFAGFFNMMGMGDESSMDMGGSGGYGGYQMEHMHSMGGGGGGLGGGVGGLAALLGVKKGAILAKIFFVPLLIAIPVLIILGILFIIYFIPIPIIEPGDDNGEKGDKWRSLRLLPSATDTLRLARSVLQSDECVERLSCELARFGKSYAPGEWIERKLEDTSNKFLHRISRSIRTARSGNCGQYRCPNFTLPLQRLQKFLIPSSIPGGKVNKAVGKSAST